MKCYEKQRRNPENLKKELPSLKEKFKGKSIRIFGSYVRGEQTKTSEIDMLVEFDSPVGFFKFTEKEKMKSTELKKTLERFDKKELIEI